MPIESDLPPAAPPSEPLSRIRDRLASWMLRRINVPADPLVSALADLYDQRLVGNDPRQRQWDSIEDRIALVLRFDPQGSERVLIYAQCVRQAQWGWHYDGNEGSLLSSWSQYAAQVLVALLGARLRPVARLDRKILDAIEQNQFRLEMSSYHALGSCGTTHCRAGSAIVLHPLGAELEQVFGSWLAGAVIYQVSTGRIPDFFADNSEALADMRACAEQAV